MYRVVCRTKLGEVAKRALNVVNVVSSSEIKYAKQETRYPPPQVLVFLLHCAWEAPTIS